MPAVPIPPGVEGLLALVELPDPQWDDHWDRIVVDQQVKDRLLNFSLFALRHRATLSAIRMPVHGLVLLHGPPGTGKTTLAVGLAQAVAREIGQPVLLAYVDPTAFPSQMLGESQRGVARLFNRTIPDLARRGRPTIVLLDEVESLAVSRSGASLETNPVDVHRATDAVLAGVDAVASEWPNVLFLATTNFDSGVDAAFLSRADLAEAIGLPGLEAARSILADTIAAVAPGVAGDTEGLDRLAAACVERQLDARQVRKSVLRAIVARRDLANDPSGLTLDDVSRALPDGTEVRA